MSGDRHPAPRAATGDDERRRRRCRAARAHAAARPRSRRRPCDDQSRERPHAVGGRQVEASERLPALRRSKKPRGPRRAPSGRCGRLDLHDRGAGVREQRPAERSGPQRTQLDDACPVERRGRGASPAIAQHRGTARSAGAPRPAPRPAAPAAGPARPGRSADGRADRGARSPPTGRRTARVELEPGRHQRHVVGTRERHRDPPVARREQPGGAADAGGTPTVQARDRGALAEQRERVDVELPAHDPRRVTRARARAAARRVTRPAGGPSGSRSTRPVSDMAPLAAHAASSASGSKGGRRVGQGEHGATMIARRPAARPMAPTPSPSATSSAAARSGGEPPWPAWPPALVRVELDAPVVDAPPLPSWWPGVVVGVAAGPAEPRRPPDVRCGRGRREPTLDAIEATWRPTRSRRPRSPPCCAAAATDR